MTNLNIYAKPHTFERVVILCWSLMDIIQFDYLVKKHLREQRERAKAKTLPLLFCLSTTE